MLQHFRSLFLMGLFFNFGQGVSSQNHSDSTDRQPAAAGRFYPAGAVELTATLKTLFSEAKPRNSGNIAGIVCPHAGYVFSGLVAASGYNQLDPEKQYDNVFIIASSHQVSFQGASIYNQGDYVTPLGKVKVNLELVNKLINENPVFVFNPEADRTEHSLEVQIPFIQYHLKKKFKLVPIVLGTQSAETCMKIAMALKPWFNDRNLFIFSTDFSHYPSYAHAQEADKATCDAIVSGSSDNLMKFLSSYQRKNIPDLATNLCGWTSILVMLNLIDHDPAIKISPVQYLNSGDSKYGDKKQVVGYWSMALTRKAANFDFTLEEKFLLLKTARNTIRKFIRERRMPGSNPADYSDKLKIHAGAFVTLKEAGALRGCIGRFSTDIPLYKLIMELALASSTEDSRFEPVTTGEIDQLEIEISVLSPLKKITTPEDIILGKHGIYIKKGYASGTFLPQVANETGWTIDEFLGHCARDKAGIGWNGWKDAELFIYEACVFSENELNVHKD